MADQSLHVYATNFKRIIKELWEAPTKFIKNAGSQERTAAELIMQGTIGVKWSYIQEYMYCTVCRHCDGHVKEREKETHLVHSASNGGGGNSLRPYSQHALRKGL